MTELSLRRNAGDAREFEETLRAMLTLAATAQSRQPEVASLISAIPVERKDRTVTASANLPPALLDKLVHQLAPAP